eukprot:COSAG01_NODE_5154_length_4449_cov_2.393333_1_plen_74_part_00
MRFFGFSSLNFLYMSRDPLWNDISAAAANFSPALDCSISFGRHQTSQENREKLLSFRMRAVGFSLPGEKLQQK